MNKVHIRSALGVGWSKFTSRPLYLIGVTFIFIVLFILTSAQSVAMAALSAIIYTGYLSVMFKYYHEGDMVLDDLFSVDGRWIHLGFLLLIKTLLILLGLAFFIVPGIYLAVRFMFSELYIIDRGMRPIEALRASYCLTEGSWWKLFLFSVIAALLMVIGLMAFVVGVAAVSAVLTFALISIYYSLRASKD